MFLLAAVKPGDDKSIFSVKIKLLSIFWIGWGSNPVHWSCFVGKQRPLWTTAATIYFDFCF